MDTDSFIIYIKLNIFIKILQMMLEKRYDTSNCEVDRPLRMIPKGMNKKVVGLMKDELGGKIIAECVVHRPKT